MPESPERRAEELEQLLRDQPGSRLFVQLAEEYRRLERYDDAVRTLEKGLEDQPTYVSARVLLGRCRLESGDPAGAIPELEQVLRQDQTHLLAHKLLTEAHLETGDVDAARRRLDQYEMLNESDPEIDGLRARLRGGVTSGSGPTENGGTSDDLFDLGPTRSPAPSRDSEDDLLGVWAAEPDPEPEREPELEPQPPVPSPEPSRVADEDPFGDLWTSDERQRLDAGFRQEGLFAAPDAEEESADAEAADDEVSQPAEAEVVAEPGEPEEPEERQATMTLGRLYLQQGHEDEARNIFRRVLEREPDNSAARAELLRLEPKPEPESESVSTEPEPAPEPPVVAATAPVLTAADLEDPGAAGMGLTERKVRILDNYLRRIRRAAETHVR